MNIRQWVSVLFLCVAGGAAAESAPEDFRKEWPDFRYLEPKQVRELPAPIRGDLEKRDCTIPKFTRWDAKHNVIQGRFMKADRQDWAVLCRSGDKTAILVYPGGEVAGVEMIKSEEDDPHRMIHTVTAFVLGKRAIRDNPASAATTFDHDGIEDGPIQKSAIVLYYNDGTWEEL